MDYDESNDGEIEGDKENDGKRDSDAQERDEGIKNKTSEERQHQRMVIQIENAIIEKKITTENRYNNSILKTFRMLCNKNLCIEEAKILHFRSMALKMRIASSQTMRKAY